MTLLISVAAFHGGGGRDPKFLFWESIGDAQTWVQGEASISGIEKQVLRQARLFYEKLVGKGDADGNYNQIRI